MKLLKIAIMLFALLLGLCFGGIAKELPTFRVSSLAARNASPSGSNVPNHSPNVNKVVASTALDDPASACPSNISSGDYQFPHLIVPTSVGMPNSSIGNQYMVYISPAATTLFNFDIPVTYTGTCALLFLFPFMSELDPSAGKYKYSGIEQVEYQNGGLNFALLDGVATNSTTFNTTPPVAVDFGKTKILPGNEYSVASFPCPAGKNITIQGSSVNKTELDYFQNTASKPIGLFLVKC